ncbi:uncharacterized protein [Misgurnus anguillicaudatus]|uniref:uncharacterized protein n=1 Tax=Misgurnus anguillicaudatus TaxID=75329 RepID=UPI003CCF95C6
MANQIKDGMALLFTETCLGFRFNDQKVYGKMMEDLCDFLKSRNVSKDIIQRMQQDKIDCSVLQLMTDDQLKEYLPSYGDRLAVHGYCRRKEKDPTGRKSKLFDRLKTRLARSTGDADNACDKRTVKNAQKNMQKIEMGWMHFREGKFTQVRTKKGGGTRKISVSKDCRKSELLEKAAELFFPGEKCSEGSIADFVVDITDFQEQAIDEQITVGELYDQTKLPVLRFYLTTRKKVIASDTHSDFDSGTIEQGGENMQDENVESDIIYVGSSSVLATGSVLVTDSITNMTDVSSEIEIDTAWQPYVHSLDDSSIVTFSTGHISGIEDTLLDDTLPLLEESESLPSPADNPPEPTVQNQKRKRILVIHRGQVLQELIAHFCEKSVLMADISMKVILPDGRLENAVDEGGVLRDVLSDFWNDFYEQCTLGNSFKVPYLRHDFGQQQWESIGRILAFGWQKEKYMPVKLAPVMLEQAAHGCVTTSLVDCFLKYVPEADRMILESCRSHFEDVDKDELFEVLDHHNCRRVPTADNVEQLLEELGHQKLIQEPAFVIEQWHNVLAPLRMEFQDITAAYNELHPTSRKIMKSIVYPAMMNEQQKHSGRYLSTFLRESDVQHLSLFLRFCTGSDLFLGKTITISFTQLEGFERRPIAHTCGCYLELPVSYDNYPEFRHEMNKVLESNIWVMDII